MQQPDPVYVLKATEAVSSVTFLNQQLLVGKKSGKIAVYCLSSLRSNYYLKASESPILFMSSDTESLVSQDRDGVIKVWDLEKSGYVFRHEIDTKHIGFTRAQQMTGDKNLLVAPSDSSNIAVYDLTTASQVQLLEPPSDDIKQLTSIFVFPWSNGNTYLLGSYESGHLVLYDLKQSKAVHHILYDFAITTLAYDLESNRGFVGGPANINVRVFGIDKLSLELYFKNAENIEYMPLDNEKLLGISAIKIRPDRKCIMVGTCNGIIYIHSFKSLRKLATLRNEHRGEISDIAYSPGAIDGFKSYITAISGSDGNVSLWDIYYKYRSD